MMNDLISRADAIRIASGYCHQANIAQELAKLPSAQPERKKGKWDKKSIAFYWKCSECGTVVNSDRHTVFLYPIMEQIYFCPYCGADMRGEEE